MGLIGKVSVGAFADSGYEYMLKQWLLSGRTDTKARDLCMFLFLFSPVLSILTQGIHRPSLGQCDPRSAHIHIA